MGQSSPSLDPRTGALITAASRDATRVAVGRWLIHELRNPLQTLALVPYLVDPANGNRLDEKTRTMLSNGIRDLSASIEILDQVLIRPTAETPLTPLAVNDVLQLFDTVQRCQQVPTSLSVTGKRRLPAVAASDTGLMHVLLVLVVNAVEAIGTQTGGLISTTASSDNGIVISVEDNGPGLAPEVADRIFEPFVTTKSAPGAGLGLSAARWLLEGWGGGIRYDKPESGQGCRFTIRLRTWAKRATPRI